MAINVIESHPMIFPKKRTEDIIFSYSFFLRLLTHTKVIQQDLCNTQLRNIC